MVIRKLALNLAKRIKRILVSKDMFFILFDLKI